MYDQGNGKHRVIKAVNVQVYNLEKKHVKVKTILSKRKNVAWYKFSNSNFALILPQKLISLLEKLLSKLSSDL